MKQLYLLPLLFFLTGAAFAQQKFAAGFTVKAGTFTWPHERSTSNGTEYYYPAGNTCSFGVFASARLGGHFRLSWELFYNFSAYEQHERYNAFAYDVIRRFSWNKQEKKVGAHSVIVPLKIYFSPKKDGRLSVSVGVAANQVYSSHLHTVYKFNSEQTYSEERNDAVKRYDGSNYRQLLLTAGAHCKIDAYTSVGLEFMGPAHGDIANINRPDYSLYSSYYYQVDGQVTPFWMKSLAISLHHNMLRSNKIK